MRLIGMFIAIALAAGAFFIMLHFTSNKSDVSVVQQPQTIEIKTPTTDVYTAKQDIPIGAIIKPEMLDIQPWPKNLMLPDMVPADEGRANDLIKMVARTPFQKGEPIIMNKLANDKDPSFLAASLPKGMRAVTIATDGISGVGGFVFPGDRVDVLVTHDVTLGKPEQAKPGTAPLPPKKDPVTEVLLSNIRVMAVNQKSTAHGGEPPTVPSSVSLEVSAEAAQKLRLTENGNGRLSLTLRSLKDQSELELARPTGVGDLSRLTPPSNYSVLYDANGHAIGESPDTDVAKLAITVVRGVHSEDVEVSRP